MYGLIDRPYIHEIKKKKCISSLRKMPALPCSAFNVLVSLQWIVPIIFFFLNKTLESTNSFKHIIMGNDMSTTILQHFYNKS